MLSKEHLIKARSLIPYRVLMLVPALCQIGLKGLQGGDGRKLRVQLFDIALQIVPLILEREIGLLLDQKWPLPFGVAIVWFMRGFYQKL